MSHGLGCAVEAVVEVQEERRKENKGTVTWIKVQPSKGNWGGKVKDDRVKGKSVRVIVACGHDKPAQPTTMVHHDQQVDSMIREAYQQTISLPPIFEHPCAALK